MMALDTQVQKALKNINNPNFTIRKKAIQAVARARYEPAVPQLVKILHDDKQHERVRALIARALGRIGSDACFRALVVVLGQIDPAVLNPSMAKSHDHSETYQLQHTMLSVAVTVSLQMIGTPDARKILQKWHAGELHKRKPAKKQ